MVFIFPTSKSYIYVVALIGDGNNPQPGEISLAHNGVLFANELPGLNRQPPGLPPPYFGYSFTKRY